MRLARLTWPLMGAGAGVGVTLLCLYVGGNYNLEWVLEILTPGIWIAELTNSVSAGVFTMVLIGAFIGTLFELLTGSSETK